VLVVAAALLVGVVTIAACSSDDDDAAPSKGEASDTTVRATTTTTSARAAEEDAVKQAREKADEVWKESAAPPHPNPDNPAIAQSYVGPMLDRITATLQGFKANGYAIRYPDHSQYRLDIKSIRFDEDKGQEVAFLDICGVDDGERFDMASGDVLEGGVRTVELTEAMRKVDGEWKLAERRRESYQEGVAGCASGQ
jgi:hypothetical protein